MWEHSVYAGGLLFGIAGMAIIDWRFQLAFWYDRRRTTKVIVSAVGLFVLWDIAGILLGIFSDGDGRFRSGLQLGPHFPIEEILFLTLLSYCTLVIWRFFERSEPS